MSDFRKGVCQDCNAEFNIPADFPHDRARCRQCGEGVVVIEPAAGAPPAPKPVPAATPPPAKKKPADGMTMKEKILARKKAEAAARAKAVAVAKPGEPAKGGTQTPAKNPVPAKPMKAGATRKTAAASSDEEKPARAGRAAGGARAGKASKRAGGKAGGRAGARGGRGGARGKRGGDEERGARRGRGRAAKEEKKAPVGAIVAVLVLILGGVGAWAFLAGPLKKEEPKTTDVANNDAVESTDTPSTTEASADAPETMDPVDAGAVEGADDTTSLDDVTDEMSGAEDAGDEAAKPEEQPVEEKTFDPSEITFDEYPVFDKAVGTTDEEWEDIQKKAAQMFDPSGGARQSRAVTALREYGFKSYPAIMNEVRNLDLSTPDAYVLGDMFNQMMVHLQNGKNANWVYTRDEETDLLTAKAQYMNKKIITIYLKTWNEVANDPTIWVGTAKLTQDNFKDQLEAYAQLMVDAGVTEGEYIDDILDAYEGAGSGGDDDDLDDLDDF